VLNVDALDQSAMALVHAQCNGEAPE